ncbi:MAG TPA: helix-turn-helix transcriptional regulator [Flavobacteriales bacterium]|nr:helix-turn-helix transcriptional regulator [Flavobacteriales bacterium]
MDDQKDEQVRLLVQQLWELLGPSPRPLMLPDVDASLLPMLSGRQLEVALYLCDPGELSYEVIAEKMHVALSTFHQHRRKLFKRLGVHTRAGVVNVVWRLCSMGRKRA